MPLFFFCLGSSMPIGIYDIETRSTVNLTLSGAWKYAAHPTTDVLCMYIAVDAGEPERWLPGEPIPAAFIATSECPEDWKLIAHNHEFERAIYELILMPRFGFPPIPFIAQHCTQQLASRNAYPAELGLLSQALGLPYRKDREAAKAMRDLSRPRKPRRGEARNQVYWIEDEAKRQLLFERCRLDVITTRAVWTHPALRHSGATERHSQVLDATINRRGIRLDRGFVVAGQALAVQERNAINLRLAQLTAGSITSVDQVKRFVELINSHGHSMTTLNKRGVACWRASPATSCASCLSCAARARAHRRASSPACSPTPATRTTDSVAPCAGTVADPGAGSVLDPSYKTLTATTSVFRSMPSTWCAPVIALVWRSTAIRSP
jgi:hypothetical protein